MLVKGFSKLVGVGQHLPDEVVHSDDLMHAVRSERFGFKENFISRIIGIEERRVSREHNPLDMALFASLEAIDAAGIEPIDIDMIVFCGIEGHYSEPSTAHLIQHSIGAKKAICFDISNACLGLMSGIMTGNAFIGAGAVENVLICSGEQGSTVCEEAVRLLSKTKSKDRFNKLIGGLTVGDAGGAFVMTKKVGNEGFTFFNTQSKGEMAELCWYRHEGNKIKGQMDIGKIAGACIDAHKELISDTYRVMGWKPGDVDSLTAHQVGKRIHRQHAQAAGVELSIAANTHRYLGNLASVTIAPATIANAPIAGEKSLYLVSASGISVGQTGHVFDRNIIKINNHAHLASKEDRSTYQPMVA